MVGMIVWVCPFDDRPNAQRGKIEAIAAEHMMLTMCGDGAVVCVPLTYMVGIEFDNFSIEFKVKATKMNI